MVTLRIDSLTLGYRGQTVLQGVSLQAAPGEMLGLVGPNGCGKSTLIRGVTRLLPLREGNIWVNGKALAGLSRGELARFVAVVPQNPSLPETFTALELVLMGRTPHLGLLRYETSRDLKIAVKAMQLTDTAHLAGRRVGELSGGERQRVVIARALAQEPRLLLLDEPTAHLDLNHQAQVMGLVRHLCHDRGVTCMVALHDLNLASQYCDRLAMLARGGIHAQGAPQEVLTVENIRQVYGADVCILAHPANALPVVLVERGKTESLKGEQKWAA